MTDSPSRPVYLVCLASFFKGGEFIRECKRQHCRVVLVTKEKLLGEDWPRAELDGIISVPNDATPEVFIHTVTQLARPLKLDLVIALEEYDVVTAALIREHLRIPGMEGTTARRFRDKLAMRSLARDAQIRVPEFVHLVNYDEIGQYMERTPAPWVLKPRSDVSAIGIKKMHDSEQVWRAIDVLDARERLGERSSHYLLERYVPGEVYHVDSLVEEGKVIFAGANRYGRPPMDVAHGSGVYISYTIEHDSDDERQLFEINSKLVETLGLKRGAAHAEFIKSAEDGQFYFLEIASRVGGSYISEVLEAARGINLWREWARLEITRGDEPYRIQPQRNEYSGIVLSLARQEWPDTSTYTEEEIVYRVKKRHHVGLIVRSPQLERVQSLLDAYAQRFNDEFSAVVPPLERPE
ncbi:MAG TPA: ATP-grasp domain-containing protein [Pyrinomonadaceae bacterium]